MNSKQTEGVRKTLPGQLRIDISSPLSYSKLAMTLNKTQKKEKVVTEFNYRNCIKKNSFNHDSDPRKDGTDILRKELTLCRDKLLDLQNELYIKDRIIAKLRQTIVDYQMKHHHSYRTFKLSMDETVADSKKESSKPFRNTETASKVRTSKLRKVSVIKEILPRTINQKDTSTEKSKCVVNSHFANWSCKNAQVINKYAKINISLQKSSETLIHDLHRPSSADINSRNPTSSTKVTGYYRKELIEPEQSIELNLCEEELEDLESLIKVTLDLKSKYNHFLNNKTSLVNHNYDHSYQYYFRERASEWSDPDLLKQN